MQTQQFSSEINKSVDYTQYTSDDEIQKFNKYPNSFINNVTALGNLMRVMGVDTDSIDYLETRGWWTKNILLQKRVYHVIQAGGAHIINGLAPDFSEHIQFCEDYVKNKHCFEDWLLCLVENIPNGTILLELEWFNYNLSVIEWIWQINRISLEKNTDGLLRIDAMISFESIEQFTAHLIDIYHSLFSF